MSVKLKSWWLRYKMEKERRDNDKLVKSFRQLSADIQKYRREGIIDDAFVEDFYDGATRILDKCK